MRIVFVLPRYHTNLHHWISKHLEEGDEVKVLVYHNVKRNVNCPVPVDPVPWSRLTSWIRRRKPDFSVLRYGIPDRRVLKEHLRGFQPDLIVIRDPARFFSIATILTALRLRLPFVLYTQAPLHGSYGRVKRLFLSALVTLLHTAMISPVRGNRLERKSLKRFFYLPFSVKTEVKAGDLPAEQLNQQPLGDIQAEQPVLPADRHPDLHPNPRPEQAAATDSTGSVKLPGSGERTGEAKILMIGKYIPRKNHRLLIDAAALIENRLPLTVTMIGGITGRGLAERKELIREYIREKGMGGRIEQREVLPYRELQKAYDEFDLFVLPSRDEEVGVTVLEAMARGLPVICSDTAGAADFIREGVNGAVFRSDDVESLAGAIECCLGDPERTRRMGRKSRWIAEAYHSPERYHLRLKLLIEKVLR